MPDISLEGDRVGGSLKEFALIDARPLLREALTCWLSNLWPDCKIKVFNNIETFNATAGSDAFGVVLLWSHAASFPGSKVEDLSATSLTIPMVVISETDKFTDAVNLLHYGVRAIIPSSTETSVLVGIIDFVMAGSTCIPTGLSGGDICLRTVFDASANSAACINADETIDVPVGNLENRLATPLDPAIQLSNLTSREREVLACLRRGMQNKHVAYYLAIRENTVKVHIRHLMKKLHATNRTEAVLLAEGTLLR